MRRYWTVYLTTAATSNLQIFPFPTNDDYRVRHLKTIFVGVATAGLAIAPFVAGQEYSLIDTSRFAAGDFVLQADIDLPAKIQLQIGLQDIAGSAHTNVPVVIGYDVDPGSGP